MNRTDQQAFREMLLRRRAELAGEVDYLQDEALSKSGTEATGDLSSYPSHMPDVGTDNYQQEFTIGILQTEEEQIREIDLALARIESGEFGLCESCSRPIPKARLKALPYARLCLECKEKEERAAR